MAKHKAFGVVRREIAKKIREHKRRRRKAKPALRKKLDLAVRQLTAASKAVALAYTSKACPPK